MPRYVMVAAAMAAVLVGACATHVPEPEPHPNAPHITWSVAEGTNDKEVCRSTEPAPCTLTLSSEPPNNRLGVFHVFLHAGATDTKYVGTINIGFLVHDSGSQHEHKVDRVITRDSGPVNFSSTGIVKPAGTYYVDVNLTATAADGPGRPLPITARIRVDVK